MGSAVLPVAVVSTAASLQHVRSSTVASSALATSYSNKTVPKHKYFPPKGSSSPSHYATHSCNVTVQKLDSVISVPCCGQTNDHRHKCHTTVHRVPASYTTCLLLCHDHFPPASTAQDWLPRNGLRAPPVGTHSNDGC